MLSGIPSLLGRDFVVGYYLPVGLFVIAVLVVLQGFGLLPDSLDLLDTEKILDTALMAIGVWLLSIVVASLNFQIIRYLEGYLPRLLPFAKRMKAARIAEFVKIVNEQKRLRSQLEDPGLDHKDRQLTETTLINLTDELAKYFPDRKDRVLPTRFGNAIRAFEVYPHAVYGLEATGAWPRVFVSLTDRERDALSEQESYVNFWVNLWIGSVPVAVLSVIYWIGILFREIASLFPRLSDISAAEPHIGMVFVLAGAIGLAFVAPKASVDAAVAWGTVVKSCFDLHWKDVVTRVHGRDKLTRPEVDAFVHAANQAFLYRRRLLRPPNIANAAAPPAGKVPAEEDEVAEA